MTDPPPACCDAPSGVDSDCPRCGERGAPVSGETLGSLVGPEWLPDAVGDYRYCCTPTCATVYFRDGGGEIPKDALTVRVGCKETADPIPVCYCFGVTRKDIADEIAATGASTASGRITGQMEADACDCLHKNPSGRCCLGEVKAAEKALARDA